MDFADAESTLDTTPWHNLTPQRVYERSLAIELLQQSVASLEEELKAQGNNELFQLLLPNLGRSDDASAYRDLETATGMTADALKMTVSRWRKKLREHVRHSLRQAASSEQDVDADIAQLFASF